MRIMVTRVTRENETERYGWQTKNAREKKVSDKHRKPNWSYCLHVKEYNDIITRRSLNRGHFYTQV